MQKTAQSQPDRGLARRFRWAVLPVLFLVGWEVAAILIDNPFILPDIGSVAAGG
jgi:hypothetical protein